MTCKGCDKTSDELAERRHKYAADMVAAGNARAALHYRLDLCWHAGRRGLPCPAMSKLPYKEVMCMPGEKPLLLAVVLRDPEFQCPLGNF